MQAGKKRSLFLFGEWKNLMLIYLLLHAIKERSREVRVKEIWSPLEKFGILGGHGYGRQVEGHATTASGCPVAPHMRPHMYLKQ